MKTNIEYYSKYCQHCVIQIYVGFILGHVRPLVVTSTQSANAMLAFCTCRNIHKYVFS